MRQALIRPADRHCNRVTVQSFHAAGASVQALSALVVLVVLVGAPPVLLTHFIGNPTAGLAHFSFTKPLTDTAVKDILAIVIWLAWAQLVACIVAEFAAAVRGAHLPRRVPLTLGVQQRLARQLVVAVLAFLAVSPALAPASGVVGGIGAAADVTATSYAATAAATPPAVAPAPGSVVVKPGDDLARLAQTYLGSAHRWTEIWELNEGSAQPAGEHFTDPSLIRPGWTLQLPTTHIKQQTASSSFIDVVVHPHDSMWSIAAAHLGSGEQWTEIWEANRGRIQSDGRSVTDPAKIRPGWVLRIPTPTPRVDPIHDAGIPSPLPDSPAAPPETSGGFEPSGPSATTRETSTPTPLPLPSPSPAVGAAEHANGPAVTSGDNTMPARSAHASGAEDERLTHMGLGLSAVAAAAVVGAVGRRRVLQHRHRRAGRRIAMPGEPLRDAELELRVTENSEVVRLLDRAARTLMLTCQRTGDTFPPVAVVRLFNRGVELLLAEAAPAIEPFIAAGSRVWRFDSATAGHLLASDGDMAVADVPFPFPLLVTIGVDERGPVLVNLETAGALTVIGDPATTLPVLRAAAAELATGVLGEMATVELIRVADCLATTTETGRATTHNDLAAGLVEPRRFHAQMTDALAVSGCATMHEARTRGKAELTWPSRAVICAGPLTGSEREALVASTVANPGAGTGVITTATDETQAVPGWVLRPAAQLRLELEPFGLTVQPQRLTAVDLAAVNDLLAVSGDQDDTPARDSAWATAAAVVRGNGTWKAADAGIAAASGLSATRAGAEAGADPGTPMVRVLGPVTVTEARGNQPTAKLAKATEIAAYLALHPDANRDRVTEAVWPVRRIAVNYRQQVMSSLRGWLGTADDGEPYLGMYVLHTDVRCDWTQFETLAKRGFGAGADGLPDLELALALVRDRPFAGIRSGTYAWADVLVQEDIIPAIRDVADAVATIRLAAGDPAGARAAAAKGLLVEPCSEVLLRLALRAAHMRRDHDDVAGLIARIDKIEDELDDNDPETAELLAMVQLARTT